MWIFLEPHDRWLFRDARPFTAGEAFRARTQWPPNPAPMAGAVKTWLIKQRGVDPEAYARAIKNGNELQVMREVGGHDDLGCLRLKGPLICRSDGSTTEPFFPLPRDLMVSGLLRPLPAPPPLGLRVRASQGELRLTWARSLTWKGEEDEYVLTLQGFQEYLQGRSPVSTHLLPMTELAKKERHVGIQLQRARRQVEAGMLYAAQFIRPDDALKGSSYRRAGLLVEVQHSAGEGSLDGLDGARLWLGGERRAATVVRLSQNPLERILGLWNHRAPTATPGSWIVVYLLTPAVFQKGWQPDAIADDGTLNCGSARLKLEAAAVGKPLPVARWDLAWSRPRALYRAVPAGSVYYFALQDGDPKEAVRCLHGTTHLQEQAGEPELQRLHQMGFGWTLVGERG
jgi:CRISPR-associated protein Cmr3